MGILSPVRPPTEAVLSRPPSGAALLLQALAHSFFSLWPPSLVTEAIENGSWPSISWVEAGSPSVSCLHQGDLPNQRTDSLIASSSVDGMIVS
jgi:hypothetical protein